MTFLFSSCPFNRNKIIKPLILILFTKIRRGRKGKGNKNEKNGEKDFNDVFIFVFEKPYFSTRCPIGRK